MSNTQLSGLMRSTAILAERKKKLATINANNMSF